MSGILIISNDARLIQENYYFGPGNLAVHEVKDLPDSYTLADNGVIENVCIDSSFCREGKLFGFLSLLLRNNNEIKLSIFGPERDKPPEIIKISRDTKENHLKTLFSPDSSLGKDNSLPVSSDQDKDSPQASKYFISKNPHMQKLEKEIEVAAAMDDNVTLYGETGTGKDIIARRIHDLSSRRDKPFVVLDLKIDDPTMTLSILFGHKKGAFTGANDDKKGLIDKAEGGTIYIPEITSMKPDVQNALLRFIETQEYRAVGSDIDVQSDVRIICAVTFDITNGDDFYQFRLDLLGRIACIELFIPPLRERKEDIIPLAEMFLSSMAKKKGITSLKFSPDAVKLLKSKPWLRNIRELRAAVLCMFTEYRQGTELGMLIKAKHLKRVHDDPRKEYISRFGSPKKKTTGARNPSKKQILRAVAACEGNKAAAARKLKVCVRTVYRAFNEKKKKDSKKM